MGREFFEGDGGGVLWFLRVVGANRFFRYVKVARGRVPRAGVVERGFARICVRLLKVLVRGTDAVPKDVRLIICLNQLWGGEGGQVPKACLHRRFGAYR